MEIPHLRAPWEIVAFIVAIKENNRSFFEKLEEELMGLCEEWKNVSYLPVLFFLFSNLARQ